MTVYRFISTLLFLLLLGGLGIAKYTRVTPEEHRRLEFEAALKQMYSLEQVYFAQHQCYFDPADSTQGIPSQWLKGYRWESRANRYSFWVLVRADLDEDGEEGIWRVDEQGPQAIVAD